MATFVLIHGAWHGPWCFDACKASLQARGHTVIVPELPADDASAGLDRYARVVTDATGAADVPRHRRSGTSNWADPEVARQTFYGDCSETVALEAVARLRPQASRPELEPWPQRRLPEVPSAYVLCTRDAAIPPDFQRVMARDRLGIEPIEFAAGHSPFLSSPEQLADVLTAQAARTTPSQSPV